MLKRVSIQNFKSLKDVTLDLQKVNLLIGPNNSGKTNFLKALEFVKENYREFPRRKDASLVFNHTNDAVHFLLVDDSEDPVHINITYNVTSDQHSYRVYNSTTEFTGNGLVPHIPGQRELERMISGVLIYKPDPNKLIYPGVVGTGEEVVNADGSNLVGFLDLMLGKYRRTVFDQIETDIHTCIPEFTEIKIDDARHVSEDLKIMFGDRSFKRIGLANSKQGITYWSNELSEGTLYFLALLCIINQPNPPKLLLLEEPEKGIHPRRIFEVIQFIFKLAEEKDVQVIMTTHSPLVVDMFKDMTESVFIFDKDDEGATHVKNLQHDVIEPETIKSKELGIEAPHYTDSLGDAWTVGFLGGVPK